MIKLLTMSGLLTLTLTISAHADVNLIQSKINGIGYKTNGKAVSILSPTITLNGQALELHTGSTTAKSACEMLGLDYLGYDQGDAGKIDKRVRLDENGSIEFIEGSRFLSVLSCNKRN